VILICFSWDHATLPRYLARLVVPENKIETINGRWQWSIDHTWRHDLRQPSFEDSMRDSLHKDQKKLQWDVLDSIVAIAHSFILGIKVYPALAAAVTAIEMASTKAVELTVQCIAIQLPFMAEDKSWKNAAVLDKKVVGSHSRRDRSISCF